MQTFWPGFAPAAEKVDAEAQPCQFGSVEVPKIPRSKVYKGVPFQPGEEARYELKYGGLKVHVGYGFLRVGKPIKHKIPVGKEKDEIKWDKRWHRSFSVEASTGDWYKAIFRAHDKLLAYSRPSDFGISKFYISEDHDKPFSRRTQREKWLDFNHVNCQVQERELDHQKKFEKEQQHHIISGAVDALGAVYKLRTMKFELNKPKKFIVYTSKQNWWLEANPVAREKVKTKLGEFNAMRLKVSTSMGEDLEQKGAIDIWLAPEHPQNILLRVEGEAKFGSFYLEIDRFTAGS